MTGCDTIFSLSTASQASSVVGSQPGVILRVASMPKAYLMSTKRWAINSVWRTKPMSRLHKPRMKSDSVIAQT